MSYDWKQESGVLDVNYTLGRGGSTLVTVLYNTVQPERCPLTAFKPTILPLNPT